MFDIEFGSFGKIGSGSKQSGRRRSVPSCGGFCFFLKHCLVVPWLLTRIGLLRALCLYVFSFLKCPPSLVLWICWVIHWNPLGLLNLKIIINLWTLFLTLNNNLSSRVLSFAINPPSPIHSPWRFTHLASQRSHTLRLTHAVHSGRSCADVICYLKERPDEA